MCVYCGAVAATEKNWYSDEEEEEAGDQNTTNDDGNVNNDVQNAPATTVRRDLNTCFHTAHRIHCIEFS